MIPLTKLVVFSKEGAGADRPGDNTSGRLSGAMAASSAELRGSKGPLARAHRVSQGRMRQKQNHRKDHD